MEITYHIVEKDILAGRRLMRKVSREVKRTNTMGMSLILLIPCVSFILRRQFTAVRIAHLFVEIVVFALGYAVLKMILDPLFDMQAVTTLKQESSGVLGEHKICLTEEALIESTSVNESHQKWTGIERIDQNKDYIFIVIGNQRFYVIPKKAFISSDAAKQFYDQARSYHEKSQVI